MLDIYEERSRAFYCALCNQLPLLVPCSTPPPTPLSAARQSTKMNRTRHVDDYDDSLFDYCVYLTNHSVAVVICFFLCWAPFHAQRLIAIYSPAHGAQLHDQHEFLYTVMTYVSGVLYYLSTCINPLLYNLMSNKFREAFRVSVELNLFSLFINNLNLSLPFSLPLSLSLQAVLLGKKYSKGSLNSRHQLESHRLRRTTTLNSTSTQTQRESIESSKQALMQVCSPPVV